jgi:hypothetical protein
VSSYEDSSFGERTIILLTDGTLVTRDGIHLPSLGVDGTGQPYILVPDPSLRSLPTQPLSP